MGWLLGSFKDNKLKSQNAEIRIPVTDAHGSNVNDKLAWQFSYASPSSLAFCIYYRKLPACLFNNRHKFRDIISCTYFNVNRRHNRQTLSNSINMIKPITVKPVLKCA